jgi:rhodanese-related sulfurtransferase
VKRSAHIALQALALIAVGLAAGAAHSWRTPVHLRLEPAVVKMSEPPPTEVQSPTTGAPVQGDPAPAPLGLHITLVQAKGLYDQGTIFVDARTDRDYLAGAISGAQHITPAGFSKPETTEQLRFIDPSQPLVIYCGGGDCNDSENLVILLQQYGYKELHIMTDGYPAWKDAGYDVEIPTPAPGSAR